MFILKECLLDRPDKICLLLAVKLILVARHTHLVLISDYDLWMNWLSLLWLCLAQLLNRLVRSWYCSASHLPRIALDRLHRLIATRHLISRVFWPLSLQPIRHWKVLNRWVTILDSPTLFTSILCINLAFFWTHHKYLTFSLDLNDIDFVFTISNLIDLLILRCKCRFSIDEHLLILIRA